MKKRRSKTTTVCLLFLLFVVIHHFTLSPFSRLKFKGIKNAKPKVTSYKPEHPWSSLKSIQPKRISCDRKDKIYDLCTINGPTIMDPITSTFYLLDPKIWAQTPYIVEKIKPYPRKWESIAMKKIKELTLTSNPQSPACKVQHKDPALVFSLGGSIDNFFIQFNEGLIPLFITVNYVFPENQDFVLVISQAHNWWVQKYSDLLYTFSKHSIINLDNETFTHCFPSATFGLVSHGYMSIDPTLLPNSKTFLDFRDLLVKAYGNDKKHFPKLSSPKLRPQLILMSRNGNVGRVLLNEIDVKHMAQEIGFDVVVFRQENSIPMREAFELVHSSHAMIGIHGSSLTHSLFLRPGSVFLQVVPLGVDFLATDYYGNSAKAIGLEYMEYKIGVEETTLIDKYDKNSLMIKDPVAYMGKNWSYALLDIYMKEQDVRLDLVKFKECLERVHKKAKEFFNKEN